MKPLNLLLLILLAAAVLYVATDIYSRGGYEPLGHWARGWVNQWRVVK